MTTILLLLCVAIVLILLFDDSHKGTLSEDMDNAFYSVYKAPQASLMVESMPTYRPKAKQAPRSLQGQLNEIEGRLQACNRCIGKWNKDRELYASDISAMFSNRNKLYATKRKLNKQLVVSV